MSGQGLYATVVKHRVCPGCAGVSPHREDRSRTSIPPWLPTGVLVTTLGQPASPHGASIEPSGGVRSAHMNGREGSTCESGEPAARTAGWPDARDGSAGSDTSWLQSAFQWSIRIPRSESLADLQSWPTLWYRTGQSSLNAPASGITVLPAGEAGSRAVAVARGCRLASITHQGGITGPDRERCSRSLGSVYPWCRFRCHARASQARTTGHPYGRVLEIRKGVGEH